MDKINNITFTALPNRYTMVDDFLIRGPKPKLKTFIQLKKEGVNNIFDFRNSTAYFSEFKERVLCKLFHIKYNKYPYNYLKREFPTVEQFQNVAQNVVNNGKNGGKTLFHCYSGKHRTAHMACFYDITKGKTLGKIKQEQGNMYEAYLKKFLDKHIYNTNFFSRKFIQSNTKNPVKKLLERRNNKFYDTIMWAEKSFNNLLSK